MNKNQLLKKGIALTIIVMLIGLAFTSASLSKMDITTQNISSNNTGLFLSSDDDSILEYDASTRNTNADSHGISLGVYGDIVITVDVDDIYEPIEPLSGYRLVHVNVSYGIRGALAGKLLPIIQKKLSHMPIHLSFESTPEWADVIILPDIVYPKISTKWKSDTTNLFISIVNISAPAYGLGSISLEAKTEPLLGPLGIITWINPTQEVFDIGFIPGYLPLISVTPENDTIQTPPGQVVELPISIGNLGNGITVVDMLVIEGPCDWEVSIPPRVTVDVNNMIQVSLFVRASQNFTGEETIGLVFTPSYYANPGEQRGLTEFISILACYQP